MQFVLDGLPIGGNGITAVPHDPNAVTRCEDPLAPSALAGNGPRPPCVRPAFLETSRNAAELDLLRYYDDDGSTLHRPFLVKEVVYPITANAGGSDSRGIVIDSTPRLACEASATTDADKMACGQVPARLFFANRTPPSLVTGEVGGPSPSGVGDFDPDRVVFRGNVPILDGPSRVYLAPIVDPQGNYALRVFVVCYDTATLWIYDPDAEAVETVIDLGPGPFAMAFDPFSLDDVARHQPDPRQDEVLKLRSYRFAYVASFTGSYVQVVDLDQSSPRTYGHIVFTLGQPTKPKGT
jgi:hypothetical protein